MRLVSYETSQGQKGPQADNVQVVNAGRKLSRGVDSAGVVRAAAAVGRGELGVLDLYRATPGGLSRLQWRDALSAADTAALMILGLRTVRPLTVFGWP